MKKLFVFLTLCFIATMTYATPSTVLATSIHQYLEQYYPTVSPQEEEAFVGPLVQAMDTTSLERELVMGIISVESAFKAKAHSRGGSKGLMQVVSKYHKDLIRGRNLFDPGVSVEVGTTILHECRLKAHGNRFRTIACYSGKRGHSAAKYVSLVLSKSSKFLKIYKRNIELEKNTNLYSDHEDSSTSFQITSQ